MEEPVRRKVNTMAWTGATTKGCEMMRRMRGLSVLPEHLDFGVLQEGCTYSFTVSLQNTGIDACRYRIRQPPPSTGIRVLYKPGPVGSTNILPSTMSALFLENSCLLGILVCASHCICFCQACDDKISRLGCT